jgi:hypothetical protein
MPHAKIIRTTTTFIARVHYLPGNVSISTKLNYEELKTYASKRLFEDRSITFIDLLEVTTTERLIETRTHGKD